MTIEHWGPEAVPDDATEVMVPMRDDVALAADLYGIATGVPLPTILVRVPYDKDGIYAYMPEIARHFRDAGFCVMVQDVRGKFRSEGVTEFGIHEPSDGYDTIEWIIAQPWSDGRVVMWGDSYYGLTQLAAVVSGHPALKAIAPRVTGSRLGRRVPFGDGTSTPEASFARAYAAAYYLDDQIYDWPLDWRVRPLDQQFEDFFTALGRRSSEYDYMLEHGEFRDTLTTQSLLSAVPVPSLWTIGWFDNCALWSWPDAEALLRDAAWAPCTYLRLEAIDHENYRYSILPITEDNDHAVSDEARARLLPPYLDPAVEFFRHVLYGEPAPARVTYEICHEGWREADQWPPAGTVDLTLHAEASPGEIRGRLVRGAAEVGRAEWVSDGMDPVPSPAENPFAMLVEYVDQSALADRDDLLTFDGEELDRDLVLAGPVTVTCAIASTAPTVELFARLLDVAPDGSAHMIARGQSQFANAGPDTHVVVRLLHAGYLVAAGHRLRLHVSSTDYPEFMHSADPGEDPWQATTMSMQTASVILGGDEGLALHLRVHAEGDR